MTFKIIVLGALLLTGNQFASAQSFDINGNTNLTNTSHIGGNAGINFPLRLWTYGAERVHINANTAGKVGYVGIGTTAPSTRLHVNGVITATGGTSANWNTAYSWGNHATQGYLLSESDPKVGTNTTSQVPRWNGSALVSGVITDDASRIGVNTNFLQSSLNVAIGTGTTGCAEFRGTTHTSHFALGGLYNENTFIRGGRDSSNVIIADVGVQKVGIGTTSPAYKLDVIGNARFTKGVTGNQSVPFIAAVYGNSSATDHDYGVYGVDNTSTGIAIYGYAPGGGLAGYFGGNVSYSGTLTGPSDIKLKKNISDLNGSLNKLMQLKMKSYNFRNDEYESLNLASGLHYGVISQDLQKVFPELVKQESNHPIINPLTGKVGETVEYLGVNYMELIPITIAALQELNIKNDELNTANAELKSQINLMNECVQSLCAKQDRSYLKSAATEENQVLLFQNQPNPFNQSTVIRYKLSGDFNGGKIIIRDLNGSLVKQLSITQPGKGQVIINANELSAGTYTYTLEIAGESVDTKLMVVSK